MNVTKLLLACLGWMTLCHPNTFAASMDNSCSNTASTTPLLAFTLVVDLHNAASEYQHPPYYCSFSTPELSHRMNFVIRDNTSGDFIAVDDAVGFSCFQRMKDRPPRFTPISLRLLALILSDAFTITSCRLRETPNKAQVSSSNASKSEAQLTKTATLNLQDNERRLIAEALQTSDGNTTQAAKKLGISEKALTRKMAVYKMGSSGQ